MSAAVALMLEGMPLPLDLHLHRAAGRVVVLVGSTVVAEYGETDLAMRNMAVVTLRRVGFRGGRVAEVFGLTPTYVARLKTAAARGGAAALAGQDGPGRPRALGEDKWDLARQWREQGKSDLEIGRRLGVAGTTVARRLAAGPAAEARAVPQQQELELVEPGSGLALGPQPQPGLREDSGPQEEEPGPGGGAGQAAEPAGAAPGGADGGPPSPPPGPGGPRISGGVFWSRYAGAMLLHAFTARAGAAQVLELAASAGQPAGRSRRFGDVALLSATSMCFALGAETIEQVKHLTAACAGPLAGLAVLPHLRTLRPGLAAIADAADPLALQEMAARAMLAADPVTSGVYYVDDHFVPYAGARPVAKGWNNKRGKAERGRADTHVTAHDGRAVCFVTGEPSGLTVTLPKALTELKKAAPPGAKIMLGFDRGGAYPQVFRHCREQDVHWVSYRRAPLAVPAMLPVITTITVGARKREIAWAEEKVQLKDYGEARQLTLSEHGKAALQILTSDFQACPAQILAWLKPRWREENFLKYASANYGIDKICDYIAGIETNTKITGNPDRKKANAAARTAEKALAQAREDLACLLADPATSPAAKNTRLIPAAQDKITAAHKKLGAAEAARDTIPAKLPANVVDPGAQVALLRTCRRGLQMVLRLLAHNAEHWLASHLNAYLQDDDEYRAITRQTIIRGLAGTITCTPDRITVELQRPGAPRVARALALLIDEINHTPPAMPGDTRPITYRLTPRPPGPNKLRRTITGDLGLAGRRQVRNLEGMTIATSLFRFEDSYARAVPGLSVPWTADSAPAPELLVLNEELAVEVGVDPAALREPSGVALLVGQVPEGVTTVAQAYAGHQFGIYVPRLGDGRALLLGEVIDTQGRRRDLHLKGSGRTRFARSADGKAVVGPMLREYLIGEAMHGLGIPTTQALAVIATGERVLRERALPGAVLTRVAASHLRVGTFQYAAASGDRDLLRALADYAIARHYPEAADGQNRYLDLYRRVVGAQASLVARWMLVGFVHGVMNTDNTTISGETIDYGPCAFMDAFDPAAVFSSIDDHGRYAYGNQPGVLQWNLARLAETLLPLFDDDSEVAVEAATEVLSGFADAYERHWAEGMAAKLGLAAPDRELTEDILKLMRLQKVDFTQFFRALSAGTARTLFTEPEPFDAWSTRREVLLPADRVAVAAAMDRVNPVYIPRNHRVEEALAKATDGEMVPFHRLVDVVSCPFDERPGLEDYTGPAPMGCAPYITYCGT